MSAKIILFLHLYFKEIFAFLYWQSVLLINKSKISFKKNTGTERINFEAMQLVTGKKKPLTSRHWGPGCITLSYRNFLLKNKKKRGFSKAGSSYTPHISPLWLILIFLYIHSSIKFFSTCA